jgi:hypothetical protein
MLKPEKNLRWFGIDMRPRWRRRVAVIATYVAFIVVVGIVECDCLGHPVLAMVVLGVAVQLLGVFSPFGPVKSFNVPPPNTFASKYILVTGLDELARYRYGVANYDAATEKQKSDLLQTYHVGTRRYLRKPSLDEQSGLSEQDWIDEREKQERIAAERWARQWLLMVMGVTTGLYLRRQKPVQPLEVVGDFLWLGILAATLAPARILWTEPDPRDAPGEIELVSTPTSN